MGLNFLKQLPAVPVKKDKQLIIHLEVYLIIYFPIYLSGLKFASSTVGMYVHH